MHFPLAIFCRVPILCGSGSLRMTDSKWRLCMSLSPTQIEKLAARKGVRKIAVENFLGSLGSLRQIEALGNLFWDAASYRWNAATVDAIKHGIRMAYAKPKPAKVRLSRDQKKALDHYNFRLREEDRYLGSVFVDALGQRAIEARTKAAYDRCKSLGMTHEHGL